ncbi:MAG: alpha/beta fold hydrolase [Gemmatimonadaceae bacterium]|nr:alpha/beta fold hydrolase [Gemmatimonadaceae bacterium]
MDSHLGTGPQLPPPGERRRVTPFPGDPAPVNASVHPPRRSPSLSADSPSVVVGADDGGEIRMAYSEHGDPGASLQVVLLHGLFDHKGTWSALAPRLAEAGYRVIAPDLVGFGRSSKPGFRSWPASRRYGAEAHVGFLRAFVESLGLDEVVLAGNSFGGGVFLRSLCTPWPGGPRVRGLVLESASGYPQARPPFVRLLSGLPGWLLPNRRVLGIGLATGLARVIVRSTLRRVFHDPSRIPEELVDQAIDILREPNTLYAYRAAARNLVPGDIARFTRAYRKIDVPTLVLWGAEDRIVPSRFATLFEAELPDATLHVFDECGHAPHLEYPAETARLIRDWMERRVTGEPSPAPCEGDRT